MSDDEGRVHIEQVEIPSGAPPEVWNNVVDRQYAYSVWGLVIGSICILAGVGLFFGGVAGHTNWTVELLGLKSTLTDAAPGAVLVVVGLFVVFATRYDVKAKGK